MQKFRFGVFLSLLSQFDCFPLMFGEFWANLMWFIDILSVLGDFSWITLDVGVFCRFLNSYNRCWCLFAGFGFISAHLGVFLLILWVLVGLGLPEQLFPQAALVVTHTLLLPAVLFRFFRCCLSSYADWLVLRFQVNIFISSVTTVFCLFFFKHILKQTDMLSS